MTDGSVAPMDREAANARCICDKCPTYFDCGEPLAFCFYDEGASACITVERGCICPGCPVYRTSNFTLDFYCVQGGERKQAINGR